MATVMGTETRWVGVTPPTGGEVLRFDRDADYAARVLADAILDGADEPAIRWCTTDYQAARDQAARYQNIHDRMWQSGRFAGWLVR